MKIIKKFLYEKFIYFLCFSFLFSVSGFPRMVSEAKEIAFPIGQVVAKGGVKYEAKEKVWKNIESSHFPIFQKGKIKTEKGQGIITLANNCQIEIDQYTGLSFDQVDKLLLSQGKVTFRIPSETEMTFKVGSLSVTKSRVLQAAKKPTVVFPKGEETIGSISLHSNGSVTVKSVQGSLSILNEDRVLLAALSSRDSITIPSAMASGKSTTMVAQAGEIKEVKGERKNAGDEEWEYLGLNAIEWIAVGYAAVLVGVLAYVFWPEGEKERRVESTPLCP
jgi:hypothetical protein